MSIDVYSPDTPAVGGFVPIKCLAQIATGIFIFALATQVAISQNASSTATRDPAATAAVQNAIAALGGATNIAQIVDCTAQGTFQINPLDAASSGTFVWKTAGSEFNYSTQTATMSRILVSGHGTPGDLRNATAFQTGSYVIRATLPYHIPGLVLLTELNNPSYSITYVGPEARDGISVVHVQTVDNSDSVSSTVTPQEWYLDASTFLPVTVQYRVPDPIDSTKYITLSKDFGAFHQVNGVQVPRGVSITLDGAPRTLTITSVVFNSGLPSSTFDVPPAGTR